MVKAKTISLNRCSATIMFDRLALNAEYTADKVGTKIVKRTIHLPYLGDDGLIRIPAQKWVYGWLKSLFGKGMPIQNTSVRLQSGELTQPVGQADKILDGIAADKWIDPEGSVPYVLDENLEKLATYPHLEYVTNTMRTSVTKVYYLLHNRDDGMMAIPLEIVTVLQGSVIESAFREIGRSLGMGPRAACTRHGTFEVVKFKSAEIGTVHY